MNKDEFYIEEYKTLKAELLALVDESVKLEAFGVAAVAALYAWLASQHIATRPVWWIPVLVPFFGLVRSWLLVRRIEHMSEYIREQIEESTVVQDGSRFSARPVSRNLTGACIYSGGYCSLLLLSRFLFCCAIARKAYRRDDIQLK